MLQLPYNYSTISLSNNIIQDVLLYLNSCLNVEIKPEYFDIVEKKLKLKNSHSVIKCNQSVGFTLLWSANDFDCKIFALNIDNSFEGIYESLKIHSGSGLFVENHPSAGFCLSNQSIVNQLTLTVKDFETLSTFQLTTNDLSFLELWLNPKFFNDEFIENECKRFADESVLTIDNYLLPSKIEELRNSVISHETWPVVGPSDYRCFKINPDSGSDDLSSLFSSKPFKIWLSKLTGLPILQPAIPILTRCLEAAGNYQILHGNYSEPSGIDLIFNFYPKKNVNEWSESLCGRIHYLDCEGSEIFQVNPIDNSLTIVYRVEGCSRFTENVKGFPELPLFQSMAIYSITPES